LQSIKISPTERTAIIGGEMVRQGGKYGESRVVKITDSEVVLRSAAGSETLRLYPDVTIKPVVTAPVASKKPVTKKRAPAPNSQGKTG
jgi:MSHA biogenesis protein MshK